MIVCNIDRDRITSFIFKILLYISFLGVVSAKNIKSNIIFNAAIKIIKIKTHSISKISPKL